MCFVKMAFNMNDDTENDPTVSRQDLAPAAQRALAEAEERRKTTKAQALPTEINGRKGEEPTRFGDWEKGGRAVDF